LQQPGHVVVRMSHHWSVCEAAMHRSTTVRDCSLI
jgi:hypothetical protein